MAAHAASLIAAGAGKSGKPCDRLTPPYIWFRRVISRMTDSVNCVAFFEPVSLDINNHSWLMAVFFFVGAGFFFTADAFFFAGASLAGAGAAGAGVARCGTAGTASVSPAPAG